MRNQIENIYGLQWMDPCPCKGTQMTQWNPPASAEGDCHYWPRWQQSDAGGIPELRGMSFSRGDQGGGPGVPGIRVSLSRLCAVTSMYKRWHWASLHIESAHKIVWTVVKLQNPLCKTYPLHKKNLVGKTPALQRDRQIFESLNGPRYRTY